MGWYERWAWWTERHRFVVDLGSTLLAALLAIPGALSVYAERFDATWIVVASILVLAPLPWCRTRPFASATAVFVASMVQLWVFNLPVMAADAVVVVSMYCVTVYGTQRAYLAACGMAVVGSVALGLTLSMSPPSLILIVPTLAIMGCAFAFGLVRRSRRLMMGALRDRAERLEIERDQQAQIATAAERARIAREMHDIVAHSLSVIIAQADGGRYAAAADPAAAQRSLGTIAETGRAALADMRRLLGVLREDQPSAATPLGLVAPAAARPAPSALRSETASASAAGTTSGQGQAALPSGSQAPLKPQPDAADIGHLVDQARDDGMRVSWARVGVERRLPPGVGLTLFRVCQEALTNVRKHAGPRPAVTVLVRWGEDEVELRIDDDGRGLAAVGAPGSDERAPTPGYGLLGMRERAEMFGGTLAAGPRQGGGFSVRFVVPIPRVSAPVPDRAPDGESDAAPGALPDTAPADEVSEPDDDHTDQAAPADLNDTRGAR
ncbi:sensor histidine kinase [Promicromonospora panici]|uniref:sensor histidine kinase n=1 Tax=Promicromonospora panici TaxID=2219658 RepID=UPI00101CFF21|nr:histidine kinase [Promicromonospora panici]